SVRGAHDSSAIVFDSAEFLLSDAARPPDGLAQWQRVSLPHRWHDTHPGVKGLGWYRIKFELAQIPRSAQAIKIAHQRSRFVDFYVNGSLIGSSLDVGTRARAIGIGSGVFLVIPPSLL